MMEFAGFVLASVLCYFWIMWLVKREEKND